MRAEFGDEAFRSWRRSYEVAPPQVDPEGRAAAPEPNRPADEPEILSEALRDVVARALPYWESEIAADLRAGNVVLVAAHGNSIRALLKYIDHIDDRAIADLEIPNGIPLRYDLDAQTLEPLVPGGRYLDPEAAARAIADAKL